MSHIVIKKVQQSSISSAIPSHVKIFSNLDDNGQLYVVDEFGSVSAVGGTASGSPSGISVELTTYSDLWTKSQTDQLGTGSYYLITDFENWYDQPDYYFDGSPKHPSVIQSKNSPSGEWYQPILVQATSKRDISQDAHQPYFDGTFLGFPDDRIKYDFTYNITAVKGTPARGRIIERIDKNGNRADFDFRKVRFIRYKNHNRGSQLTGVITNFDCVTGELIGSGTIFNSELNPNDVILIDSSSLGYETRLKVSNIVSDSQLFVYVDSSYASGIPSSVVISGNSFNISPTDYSFNDPGFNFFIGVDTGNFNSYKESWFGQKSNGFDGVDYDEDVYLLGNSCFNNKFGDFIPFWNSGLTAFDLPNNVLGDSCVDNSFSNQSYNNDFGDSFNFNNINTVFMGNIIEGVFSSNTINVGSFIGNRINVGFIFNTISSSFTYNTIGSGFSYNIIRSLFSGNIVLNNFSYNEIDAPINVQDFTSSLLVYDITLRKRILLLQGGATRLIYWDATGNPVASSYLS